MLSFFRRTRQPSSAESARDRLQILLAHERAGRDGPEYLPLLQRDILEVIRRHTRVEGDSVDIKVQRGDDLSTLEINIELPSSAALETSGAA